MTAIHDFCKNFSLNTKEEVTQFFPAQKHDTKSYISAQLHRIQHRITTGVWIDEEAVCTWARQHIDQKISTLFQGMPFQRTLIRHESNMVIQKPTPFTSFKNGIRFLVEFFKKPTQIGAVLPSSSDLAKEIVSEIPKDLNAPPRRILEIGPGTGSFTDKIIKRMNPQDRLDLVEFDESFCKSLQEKYKGITNVYVFQADILEYSTEDEKKYDFVVSGLPLNAFSASFVQKVFEKIVSITNADGKVSYFEYLFLPTIKKQFSKEEEKQNLDEILSLKNNFYETHKLRRKKVYFNIPFARVLHHKLQHQE